MKPQIVKDENGNQTGVFITLEDWNLIKGSCPEIEDLGKEIPQWEKDLINSRLDIIAKHPERLRPIEELFEKLNRKI